MITWVLFFVNIFFAFVNNSWLNLIVAAFLLLVICFVDDDIII